MAENLDLTLLMSRVEETLREVRTLRSNMDSVKATLEDLHDHGFTGGLKSPRMSPMSEKRPTPSYSAEFRERGVRLYREHRSD